MRTVAQRLVVAAPVVVAGIFGLSVLDSPSAAQSPQEAGRTAGQAEFVMIRCNTSGSDFRVEAYRGSSGAPSKKGETCPEVLSQLRRDGFIVSDIGHYDVEGDFTVYLLSRER